MLSPAATAASPPVEDPHQFDDAEEEEQPDAGGEVVAVKEEAKVPPMTANEEQNGGYNDDDYDYDYDDDYDDDDDDDDGDWWEEGADGRVVQARSNPNRQQPSLGQQGQTNVTKFQPSDKVFKKFVSKINLEKYEVPAVRGSAINPVLEQNRKADKEK